MKTSKLISRLITIAVLLLTLIFMLVPSVSLIQETYQSGEDKGHGWAVIFQKKYDSDKVLGVAERDGMTDMNLFDLADSLLELSDECSDIIDAYNQANMKLPDDVTVLQPIVLKVCAVLLYVIFADVVISLVANVVLLFVADFKGKKSKFLNKFGALMKEGLLAVCGVMLLASLLGMGYMNMDGEEIEVVTRLVFSGVNLLTLWLVFLGVRIAGGIAKAVLEAKEEVKQELAEEAAKETETKE